MKRTKLLFFALFFNGILLAQPVKFLDNIYCYIENISVFGFNQEEGRSFYLPDKTISLNGEWKFFYNETPEGIPTDFYATAFNDIKWGTIEVPSNWEMQGYGDRMFRNVNAPFPLKRKLTYGDIVYGTSDPGAFSVTLPNVPREYNPSGAYRKTFTLPSSWNGDQVFLRMEKTASASFVWVNGEQVGYNEGAQEPAEYNITDYLKKGSNTVAVFVTKYSDGYYLEGQDYWRLAGIFDDVSIYATPDVRLFDWYVVTDLDETYTNASLSVQIDVKKYTTSPTASYSLKASLFDTDNTLVAEMTSEKFAMDTEGKKQIELKKEIVNPLKWTSETPNLYTLKMELLTEKGTVLDKAEQSIGFKETLIDGDTFYLNGVAIKVNATNSHMQHADLGHAMTEEVIRKDFEILKQFNFNAVRTSHYPPVNEYLDLADEYGLFIIDEAGVESHATENVCNMPEFTEMYRERARQMVLRDRNHPCILFWSAGNESGEGININEVVKEGRKFDDTRYWMYGGNAFSHSAEEIIGPRYPSPLELDMRVGLGINETDLRPSFMDEYLSVAGNAGGGLEDYWNVIESYSRTMGGAIWDFVSPGLTEQIRQVEDQSPNKVPAHLMGNNIKLAEGQTGKAVNLNGHDQWVELYRADTLEINGDKLTISMDVYPRKLNSSGGQFITKGSNQFGIVQNGVDSLEFYIYTNVSPNIPGFGGFGGGGNSGAKYTLRVGLPDNWENNWHQITAVYDGQEMLVYIDTDKKGSKQAKGKIMNFPFTISLGRDSEIDGSETPTYMCDAMLDNVGIFAEAVLPGNFNPENAAVWLDFEKETNKGTFQSYGAGARNYGHIWGNREVQPEMWEMKKVVQPVVFTLLDAETGLVEVWNKNHFTDASQYETRWFLEADGDILQQGVLDLQVEPFKKKTLKIPYTKPSVKEGAEYRITVSSSLKEDKVWAKAGFEVAWSQLELPWKKNIQGVKQTTAKASFVESDGEVKVNGEGFEYTFNKNLGALSSIVVNGKEMLKSPFLVSVWRAPMANDLDSWGSRSARSSNWKEGYDTFIATEFYSTGIDKTTNYPVYTEVIEAEGKVYVKIRQITIFGESVDGALDQYIFGAQYNGIENRYNYTINGDGEITVHHTAKPQGGALPLYFPRFGLSFTLDKCLDNVEWYGRGPQENYPGRKSGYKIGIYNSKVDDMYVPYLKPGDYGLRTDNRWVKMLDDEGNGLQFKVNELFNFNAYPYSTENLTKSIYTYQLQKQDGITFNLDYATTGVGCSARGVFLSYRVYPAMYEREIKITPVK
ncbi:glycoside hydrolase family 2 TIM barrel-domain containing protein [uncultured Draconibacterium sp.]|uniref:glycoside hydrolase family 2 TIM barrel-domain containing protein n=1 Tax=uncultured Draconibacterium sp. TaxID=1573823 RepID=UPI003216A214